MGCLSGWVVSVRGVSVVCEGGGTIGIHCLCPPLINECDV